MITTCPHCATRVIPTRDGQCPACRRKLAADALSDSQFEAVDQVWQQVGAESASSTAAAAAPMDDPTASLSLKSTDQEQSSAPRQRQAAYVWVTPLIIGLNLLVFVALLVAARSVLPPPDLVLAWGANFGPKTLAGQWWRLFTSIFLHFGILHVALNMWVLWDTGRLVERMVGNIGFGVLYFLSGLAGSLASLAWDPSVNSAGASGAVFGVCGALLGFLARRPSAVPPAVLKSLRPIALAFHIIPSLGKKSSIIPS